MITSGIVITTSAEHGYVNGEAIYISDTSTAAVGIANDSYYVRVINNRQFLLYYDSSLTQVVNYNIGLDYTGTAEVSSKTGAEGISGLYTAANSFTRDGRGGAPAEAGISNLNYTVTSNTQNFSLSSVLVQAGWNPIFPVNAVITVNSDIYVWSDDTGTAALTVEALPEGSNVDIINNGYIIGKGGNGETPTESAQAGGPAIDLNYPVTITNNFFIAGGGGGGGGNLTYRGGGGGGAGGGAGGVIQQLSGGTVPAGGLPGGVGEEGGDGTQSLIGPTAPNPQGFITFIKVGSGGGGGRILASTGGRGGRGSSLPGGDSSGRGGGSGGGGGGHYRDLLGVVTSATGGGGGDFNNAGDDGVGTNKGGGGGGWGASGGAGDTSGGAGGKAINLNGNTITLVPSIGVQWGAIS